MPIVRIVDFAPNYKQEIFGGVDIIGFEVYGEKDQKIGSVYDLLVDDAGRIRYLVIDMGFWVFGKKILLPTGLMRMDYDQHRVYVQGMTKQQVESLPDYQENMAIDYNYEEQVRNIYRPMAAQIGRSAADFNPSAYTAETYNYEYEPALYGLDEEEQKTLKLYEERLITHKERFKTGEVALGKRVETETKEVEVPIEKERVIIERNSISEEREVEPGSVDFNEGEVARMEVYEESADIEKKAYLREEVGVRKEVERDSVKAKEKLRRQELEVNVEGQPVVKREHEEPKESTGF
jgi:uncharacterized protein (TIGR02271 family)